MSLRSLASKRCTIKKLNAKFLSPCTDFCRKSSSFSTTVSPIHFRENSHFFSAHQSLQWRKRISSFARYFHSTPAARLSNLALDPKVGSEFEDDDGTMNEFLSRFVWIMRKNLFQVYPDSDKQTIDGMLLIIVSKVVSELEKGGLEHMLDGSAVSASEDFSEDLWKTVWEVSNIVLEDMSKERRKEKMKACLQSEEVKEMCRFAGEVGVRGDMLRELRIKWAREKMEEDELYESLEQLREEEADEEEETEGKALKEREEVDAAEKKPKVVTLPKRKGKIRYKIYGLDLSEPKWEEVANKIHEAGEVIWPKEPKPITGKCKLVTEKILSLKEEDEPSTLLAEWVELLQPSRVDWINLLDRLKERNAPLYLKVAEIALTEESFRTNIHDYSKLIDIHAQENRLEDAERILKKMNENGIPADALVASVLVHMYSKAGNLERAREAFESLRSQGFQPDMNLFNSMILACVNAGQPKMGEAIMREMETIGIKPAEEIYLALLRSFAQRGDVGGVGRISTTMQFAGFQPSMELYTLLVEAYGKAGDPDQARSTFDQMRKLGHKPDDECTANMIAAYGKKNLLDKALDLLLNLESSGFEPGVATYTVLVDWLGKLQLINEAEQLLGKIAQLGEAPPFKIQVSLCDMYARAGVEKKALQALGVLESRKEELEPDEFERVIRSLVDGGFVQSANRTYRIMKDMGYAPSEALKVKLEASQAFRHTSMR
ncbi:hypothetical protein L6164_013571 [Bauhinia variegata]|uniref:Uncharacterized protein n=1 Tax=Bauhinia variegata TaxID=167791 RepID=A0ACB9NFS0_BAUVA|nr:hypothetical protein L6164_013571 [Bauhinia variegata]